MNLKKAFGMTKEDFINHFENSVTKENTFDDKALEKFVKNPSKQSPYYKFKAKLDFFLLIFLLIVIIGASTFGIINSSMELYVAFPIILACVWGFLIIVKYFKKR